MDVNDFFGVLLDKVARHRLLWLAAIVILLAFIYWRQYQGWRETDAVIDRLREFVATTERRADAIVDAAKQREVTARAHVKKQTSELSTDELCAALDRLLAEYRTNDQ